MLCVEIRAAGGPDVLVITERPDPVAGAHELLIDVAAAGVNRPDVLQRRGLYPPPEGASDIPGLEVPSRPLALAWSDGASAIASARS
jgi:NADPH2:quinone reductase